MIFVGGLFAGFVWGAYLTISCLLGLHCDQAFASMGIADFKNFLRMKVEPNKLTIYPIGLRRTPRRWGWKRARTGLASPADRPSCRRGRCGRALSKVRSRYALAMLSGRCRSGRASSAIV